MKKQAIFLTALIGILIFTLSCLKDEIAKDKVPEVKQESETTEFYAEQFEGLEGKRDGIQLAFSFPVSMVDFNPFTATQSAYHIAKIDSVKYSRLDNQQYFYAGSTWAKYHRNIYFTDIQATDVVFAPIHGQTYIVSPLDEYNQLDASNPNYTVTLIRQTKSEHYYDHKCGKNKKKFWYTIISGDATATATIDGDRCMSNVFSYKLIL